MYKEELIKITTDDFEEIALWKVYNKKNSRNVNLFLTHGTFSNKKICLGISAYLVNLGYTCWIMEWRNHGESAKPKTKFNFETIAQFDIKAVLTYLLEDLKINQLHCITHSGGGICLTMCLLNNEKWVPKISSMTLFSCQSFGACHTFKNRIKIQISKFISSLLGYIPAKIIKLGPHNESYFTMKQWYNWNLTKNFKGDTGLNYLAVMKNIKIPILSISGEADKFIAPKEGVAAFLNAFENSKNKLIHCSISNGFAENYNHSSVIYSRNASLEIWPLVKDWIETTNT